MGPSMGRYEPPLFSLSVLEPTLATSTGFIPFSRHDPNLHIIVRLEICVGDKRISTFAMIDSGCSENVIDSCFAFLFDPLALARKPHPLRLTMADGQISTGGMVTHELAASITLGPHQETLTFDVTKLQSYPLMLGIPWLKLHDPWIQWSQHRITFNSPFCLTNCKLNDAYTATALSNYPTYYPPTTPLPASPTTPASLTTPASPKTNLKSILKPPHPA